MEGAHVRVTHSATGTAAEVTARGGRFLVQGLEPGGPYTITLRRIGFVPQQRDGVFLRLGEMRELEFVLRPQSVQLDTMTVVASGIPAYSPVHAHGGTGMTISDPLLHSLPTLNRDFYDFLRLVPQISTKVGLPNAGVSAGGVGFRFNNFLIGGVSERSLSGSVASSFSGAKSVPLDAVQEYQVLLAPYDVRYGDFAGALINTVTKSGTNVFRGSAFASGRNDRLGRDTATAGRTAYERIQYGFSFGGPVVRDRLHFFVATEFQRFTYPAAGPYVGQPQKSPDPVPVRETDLARLSEIMRTYGLVAGSAGPAANGHPLRNVFSRVDLALPEWNSRVIAWNNYGASDDISYSHASASRDTFFLSTRRVTSLSRTGQSAIQVHTTLPRGGGGHNELLLYHRTQSLTSEGDLKQPSVQVSIPGVLAGRVTVTTGTPEQAHATRTASSANGFKDNLTLPLGASHVLTFGTEAEFFGIRRRGVTGSYGTWTFESLDHLALGIADRYEVGLDLGGATVPLGGAQYAAYLSDQWEPHARLTITGGLRADMLAVDGHAPYHSGIDSLFGRRTDQMPRRRIELSPRAGFTWDISGTQRHRMRGGAGIFTTRYPLAWAHTALSSYGAGGGVLRCSPNDLGPPPRFNPDYLAPPLACANNVGIAASGRGDVDLLDPNLRMMRTARGSLAYDATLLSGLRFTGELLVTHGLSDFVFVNLNLQGSDSTDRAGRVMYGSIKPSGLASPTLRASGFAEVIDLRNTSSTRSYQIATRLDKELTNRANGMFSYTYSRARDAVTPLRVNNRGIVAWASSRVLSGSHDDLTPGISSNDIPHRVVVAGTYAVPRRWRSELSFYYLGESGRPFTYIASGTQRRGDLNADGTNTNDPIYVPLSALDATEILFDGAGEAAASQRAAFETLIERTSCLRRQRGAILERNSCREPWSNTTIVSFRQSVPISKRAIEGQLDIFNVLNLLRSSWGLRREAVPALLEHVGQTAEPVATSMSIFHYNAAGTRWTTPPGESAFQLQLALRYRF